MLPSVGPLQAVVFVVTIAVAAAAGYLVARRPREHAFDAGRVSADGEHVLDLLRRAYDAALVVALGVAPNPVIVCPDRTSSKQRDRGIALARVALADGRRHRLDEPTTVAAAAHDRYAVAIVFSQPVPANIAERAQADAWRLAAGLADRQAEMRRPAPTDPDDEPAVRISETVEAAALAVCTAAAHRSDHRTALVLRDEFSGVLRLVRVSRGGDRRLEGTSALPGSAVARAVEAGVPVAASTLQELLGHPQTDRRRDVGPGLAFPLREAARPVGALVVFGPPDGIGPDQRERIEALLTAAAPRVAHLQAVEARELRAETDELTGLPNRRGLDRAQSLPGDGCAALLVVDLDHFKRVNDAYGHVAGDTTLRHLARLLRRALRTQDVAARLGGEEFALWLPDADLEVAVEVAERVRRAVETTPVLWNGREIRLTCSVGVAAVPESTRAASNLYAMADAALYRAKEGGRNRVETARRAR